MNNNIPKSVFNELKEVGIDLQKFPEDKREAVCELYGYKFNNNTIQNNTVEKTNSYVPKLTKRSNKQAAYVDALVLSLVTGLFGGIFLTIVTFAIK